MDSGLPSIKTLGGLSEFVVRKRFWNWEVPGVKRPDELAEDGKGCSVGTETGLTDRVSDSERTGLPFQAMKKVQLHCPAAIAFTQYKKKTLMMQIFMCKFLLYLEYVSILETTCKG